MGHYVISVSSAPELDGERARASLSVTGDDGRTREARVLLDAPSLDAKSWAGALTHAAEQIEIAFKGETWGVQVEDVAPLLITVDETTAGRVAADARVQAPLEVGAVIATFDL